MHSSFKEVLLMELISKRKKLRLLSNASSFQLSRSNLTATDIEQNLQVLFKDQTLLLII